MVFWTTIPKNQFSISDAIGVTSNTSSTHIITNKPQGHKKRHIVNDSQLITVSVCCQQNIIQDGNSVSGRGNTKST